MPLCKVYCNDDQNAKEFYVSHNGDNAQGQLGVEIDLQQRFIDVLEDAVIETEYPDGNGNIKQERKARYVINLVKNRKQ